MFGDSVQCGDMIKSLSCIPVDGRGAIEPVAFPQLDPTNFHLYNVLLVVPEAHYSLKGGMNLPMDF